MIYTFGYLGHEQAQLVEWFRLFPWHDDAALIDIRMRPVSRKPGWSAGPLRAALGTRYRPMRELGNRNYRGGPIEIADMDHGMFLMERLLLDFERLVLMCGCRSLLICHRHVVAEELLRRGHVVEELVLGEVVGWIQTL